MRDGRHKGRVLIFSHQQAFSCHMIVTLIRFYGVLSLWPSRQRSTTTLEDEFPCNDRLSHQFPDEFVVVVLVVDAVVVAAVVDVLPDPIKQTHAVHPSRTFPPLLLAEPICK